MDGYQTCDHSGIEDGSTHRPEALRSASPGTDALVPDTVVANRSLYGRDMFDEFIQIFPRLPSPWSLRASSE